MQKRLRVPPRTRGLTKSLIFRRAGSLQSVHIATNPLSTSVTNFTIERPEHKQPPRMKKNRLPFRGPASCHHKQFLVLSNCVSMSQLLIAAR